MRCDRYSKRVFDFIVSLLLIVASFPVWLAIMVLHRLNSLLVPDDAGPMLLWVDRISRGVPIRMPKFRTLRMSAFAGHETPSMDADLKPLEQQVSNLTWLGRPLRDHYLDELPQLFSVLRGDMSFVGPRPFPPALWEFEKGHGLDRKGLVLAGLTGPTQSRKGSTDFHEEVRLDLEYAERVRNSSWPVVLAMDVGIVLRSLRILAAGEGL